jgi:hypothetical protein
MSTSSSSAAADLLLFARHRTLPWSLLLLLPLVTAAAAGR